jgi:hypothetical protein
MEMDLMKLLQVAMADLGRVAEVNQSGAELHVEKVSLEPIRLQCAFVI